MKPVKYSDLEGLIDRGSILILDVTLWGASLVYQTICRNPAHITTKTGNKTLPTELWLEILSHAESNKKDHVYKAVYPIDIQSVEAGDGKPEYALICNSLGKWARCGKIGSGDEVEGYERCLNNPSRALAELEEDKIYVRDGFPFEYSKVGNDHSYPILLSLMETKIEFLFHDIKVSDMISRLENGNCEYCKPAKFSPPRFCNTGLTLYESMEFFTGVVYGHDGGCAGSVPCPVCIGIEYTDSCFDMCDCINGENSQSGEEYDEYVRNRLRDLGYEDIWTPYEQYREL